MSENWQQPDAGEPPAPEPHRDPDQQADTRRQEQAPAWWAANPAPGTPAQDPRPAPTAAYPTSPGGQPAPPPSDQPPPSGQGSPSPWAPGWDPPQTAEHASGGPTDPPPGPPGGPGGNSGHGGSADPPPYGGGGAQPPRRSGGNPRRGLLAAALALTLVAGAVGGVIGAEVRGNGTTQKVVSSGLTTSSKGGGGTSPAASNTVAAAAAAIMPSVVTIKEQGQTESGTGSGVVIRSDGYILTNNHVVSGAADGGSLTVTMPSGKNVSAKIVGRDTTSDLAVVKVDGQSGLKAATFGSSNDLQVGELVVAVGSPLGLSGTVTSGIVSALHRPVRTGDSSVSDTDAVLDAVQTDAPINPGNSGGPLVNSRGELVGINSAIASVGGSSGGLPGQQEQQSGNIGVGFAIPSDFAQKVADQLISTGTATHPYIGVSASTVGDTSSSDADDGTGASVQQLVANGPAAKAGLKEGDVIVKVDNRAITGVDGLVAAVRSYDIGNSVTITYTRDGQTHTARVTLAQAPASS